MKFQILIASFISAIVLTGCINEDNPLKDVTSKVLAKELFCGAKIARKYMGGDVTHCMEGWEVPHAASTEGMGYEICQDMASSIAIALSKNGYGQVTPKNVISLKNWGTITEEYKLIDKSSISVCD